MALTFPSSPVDGQLYVDTVTGNRYIYDSGKGLWKYASNNVGMTVGTAPPPSASVAPGAMWYNTNTGRTFILYDDGDSRQWVENVPAVGSFDSSTVAGYANAAVLPAVTPAFGVANAAFGKANNALANASGVVFNGLLTTSGKLTASGLQISGNVAPATGASPGIYSYEYPYVRQYVGDGTGYSFALSKKTSGGVLTDMVVLNDITGYLGVGTRSPSYLMHVANGNFAVTSSTGAGQIQITDDSDSGRGLLLKSNHSGTSNTYVGTNSSIKNIIFGIDQIERMRLDTSGQLGIGVTPTSRNNTRLQIVDGIGFPATQVSSSDANTLDDYEEGTFTAYFAGNNSGTAMFSGTNAYGLANPGTNGKYTKIGRRVYFNFYLVMAGTFSWANGYGGTTSVWIAGLPFVESSSTGVGGVYPAVNCGYNIAPGGWSAAYAAMGIIESGLSTIRVGYMGTNAFTQASGSSFASGGSAMIWSGHYETTT